MRNVVEFKGPDQYAVALVAALQADMVVVRNFIDISTAQAVNQHRAPGYERTIWINGRQGLQEAGSAIRASRSILRSELCGRFGWPAVAVSPLNIQTVDRYRTGGIKPHLDKSLVMVATSINLDNGGSDESTVFRAERLYDCNERHPDVTGMNRGFEAAGKVPVFSAAIEAGDAVIIGRGVMHMVEAATDRQVILASTKSLWL